MASSLTETKASLISVNHNLQLAEGSLQDSVPSHVNKTDEWLAKGIREAEDDLSNLIEKIRGLIGQI